MEALPDEILLKILGNIECVYTLLDSVPLVCKRWHDLSSDQSAWRSAEFDVYVGDNRIFKNDARVLLRARSLKELAIHHIFGSNGGVPIGVAFSRCKAPIRQLMLFGFHSENKTNGDAIAHLLTKNQTCLQVLHTSFSLLKSCSKVNFQFPSLMELAFTHGSPDPTFYFGELSGSCVNLKRLKIRSWPAPSALLEDVLTTAARSLLCVELPSHYTLSPRVSYALSRCSALRSIVADISCIGSLQSMPKLQFLELSASKTVQPIWRGGSFPALKQLIIKWNVLMHASWAGSMLSHLCGAAPALSDLTVKCLFGEVDGCDCDPSLREAIPEVLHFQSNLQNVDVHSAPEVVTSLQKLQTLKNVRLEIFCDFEKVENCVTQIAVLRHLQPTAKTFIHVTPSTAFFSW